jgi:hypothetical protein
MTAAVWVAAGAIAALVLWTAARAGAHWSDRTVDRAITAALGHPPLDPRDVDLWAHQIMAADTGQIIREAGR